MHSTTGKSPFEFVYVNSPPIVLCFLNGETQVASVATVLMDRDEAQ